MLDQCCSSLPRSRRMLEKCCSSLLWSHRWLEMAASASPVAADGSKWGARNGRSNSLGSARALEIARPGWSKTLHLPTFPSSSTLGSSGALDMAARARSAALGRSKWPLELARTRSALPGRSKLLGLAARKHCTRRRFRVRARSAPLGRSTLTLEPARLRRVARNRGSSPLGSAGPETLHWAGPRMPVALNTETNILRAWYARVRPSIYINSYTAPLLCSLVWPCYSETPRAILSYIYIYTGFAYGALRRL